jgi:TRAP-type C4-dicarboxylate transport system substrate-binding protein
MTLRHLLLLTAVTVAATLLAGCSSSANKATGASEVRPVVLTLANPNVGDADVGDWIQAVERLSHGSVRIELHSDWRSKQVHAERGTLADLRAGKVDVAKIPTRAWDTLGVKSFQALQAPLLVDSLELERRVLTGPLGAEMLGGVRAAGVEPVGALPGPLRWPLGVTRDLLGAADYRGARIGSRPSAVAAATARALGGRYRDMAVRASIADLDAFDDDLAGISGDGYDRTARSATTDVVLWPRAVTLVINRDVWRRLAPAQRSVLSRAVGAAVAPTMRDLRGYEHGGAHVLCGRGFPMVHAGTAGIRALRRAVEPVYRQLEADPSTRRAIDRIRELKADTPSEPVDGCRGAKPSTPATGPLVGTWHAHATRALMAAAHLPSGESVEDNYGDVTLALGSDGRYKLRNARFPGRLMGFGAWSVRGDVLSFQEEGTVEQGAGVTWRYRWNLFRGSLVLRKLSLAQPTYLVVAPLYRG